MEITLRTPAGLQSIENIAKEMPEIVVGAGTVNTLEQCQKSVAAGARFIVSPGFSREIVSWCIGHDVSVVPGCVTPSEIMEASNMGLHVLKFFPSAIYGGLSAMKALSGPFTDMKFLPTGGINLQNVGEYLKAPFIYAVGGSWLCKRSDISAGNFDKITAICKETMQTALGFEIAHVGVNSLDASSSLTIADQFSKTFGFAVKEGNSSNFAGSGIEILKNDTVGLKGHVAIGTNNITRAMRQLEKNGFAIDMSTAKYSQDKLKAVYLEKEFGGFAVHLLQR